MTHLVKLCISILIIFLYIGGTKKLNRKYFFNVNQTYSQRDRLVARALTMEGEVWGSTLCKQAW